MNVFLNVAWRGSMLMSVLLTSSCTSHIDGSASIGKVDSSFAVKPVIVTEPVAYDSDDPAIWINKVDPAKSLILGTDKGGDTGDGAIYAFDLKGKIISGKVVKNVRRPNNIDVAYGLMVNGVPTDIAVFAERNTNSIRVFALPDLKPIDNGGIPVFQGDSLRAPMGVALFTSSNGDISAIVSRKNGPSGSYLWQYGLTGSPSGVTGTVVRKFGEYSGKNEIEAIAVDNELGFVYYSDESVGVRKYYAHPDSSNMQLAMFATTGFIDNHEGISIYKTSTLTGYILISDQQANRFHVFPREGTAANPHEHNTIRVVKTSTIESDGSDVCSTPLPGFPKGLFVAMSDDKTFQFYRVEDLLDGHSNSKKGVHE